MCDTTLYYNYTINTIYQRIMNKLQVTGTLIQEYNKGRYL